jgi:hypothetical protein
MALPSCAERVEVEGEHVRNGNTLRLDHSLDGPWTSTTLILERDGEQQTVSVPNTRPDGGRLLLGTVLGLVGGAVVPSAGYDVVVGGATLADEGPFYGTVLGGSAVVVGGLLAATGWQAQPVSFEGFCDPAD